MEQRKLTMSAPSSPPPPPLLSFHRRPQQQRYRLPACGLLVLGSIADALYPPVQ